MRNTRRDFLAVALSCPGMVGGLLAAPPEKAAKNLPADGIYPHGRKMAFMGYSGDPARDLANGFTVAGPVYGDQKPYLARCFANGWPVVAHVGPKITFNDKDPARYKLNPGSLRREVEQQVKEIVGQKEIYCWAIRTEELRPWRTDEMQYLAIDIYLGLASGAKGVLIWSLFKRKEVKRTWQLWYDAYAECARELGGAKGLAQVFLFGERQPTLKIAQLSGAAAASVSLGGNVEPGTTSDQERAHKKVNMPSWTSAEYVYGESRWLFSVNSAKTLRPRLLSAAGPKVYELKSCLPIGQSKKRAGAHRGWSCRHTGLLAFEF